MNNYEEMRIESDVFATARENFDLLMQRLFKSMEKNNSDEGSITLKVDLQMSQDWVPDGKGGSIEINKPVIKHKVSIAVAVPRTLGCLALSGTALSEHLVLRVKNGVNAKQRGSKPLYCLICK